MYSCLPFPLPCWLKPDQKHNPWFETSVYCEAMNESLVTHTSEATCSCDSIQLYLKGLFGTVWRHWYSRQSGHKGLHTIPHYSTTHIQLFHLANTHSPYHCVTVTLQTVCNEHILHSCDVCHLGDKARPMHSTINVCCKVAKLVVQGLRLNILKTTELCVQLSVSCQPSKSCTCTKN